MRVIAQHQLTILHVEVQRAHAEAVGLTEFVWRTQGDSDVRDAHQDLNGQRYRYSAPPSEGLPGQSVNCGCWAESVVPSWMVGGFGFGG